ncbi:MAG: hypothetical protein V1734_02770 [Nanoarchaeota archaeon]
MFKRGQITLFIILGIVIITVVVFGIMMRKEIVKAVSSSEEKNAISFSEQSAEVKKHVEDCLGDSFKKAKDSMPPANIPPEEYNDALIRATKERMLTCLNFRQFGGVEITEKSKDMAVEIIRTTKLTSTTVIVQFELLIKQGESNQRFKEFEVSLSNSAPVGEVV